jgi:hypothetical protein
MPLTDIAIRQAKPGTAPIKLSDGGGMYLLLNPNGARYWRFNYRIGGKAKTLSLGVYPEVPLKLARERRDKFRRQLFDGIDPSEQRKAEKVAISDTFEAIAREWLALQAKTDARSNRPALSKSTWDKALQIFERLIFPYIGSRPISAITVPGLLRMLKRIEERGHHEICHRAKQSCGQIFRYAIVTGRAERDLTSDLRGALAPVATRNFAAITEPAKVGELLRAIDGYGGHEITRIASGSTFEPGTTASAGTATADG